MFVEDKQMMQAFASGSSTAHMFPFCSGSCFSRLRLFLIECAALPQQTEHVFTSDKESPCLLACKNKVQWEHKVLQKRRIGCGCVVCVVCENEVVNTIYKARMSCLSDRWMLCLSTISPLITSVLVLMKPKINDCVVDVLLKHRVISVRQWRVDRCWRELTFAVLCWRWLQKYDIA